MRLKRQHFYMIIWLAGILYASLTPSDTVPKFHLIPHFDKLVHFCMYFGYTILLIPIILNNGRYLNTYSLAVITAALTGILFEILQYFLPIGRSASILDAIANLSGSLCGILIYQLIIRNKRIEKLLFKIE